MADVDLLIGRAVNRLSPPDSGQYLKVSEVVERILPEVSSDAILIKTALRRELKDRTRRFLRSAKDIYSINGKRQLVDRFSHYSDGAKGDRWIRTPALSRAQLGLKITQMRKQQRGYDVRLRVWESIYELLPDDTTIVGQVLRTT